MWSNHRFSLTLHSWIKPGDLNFLSRWQNSNLLNHSMNPGNPGGGKSPVFS